jgi:hypothetical protein
LPDEQVLTQAKNRHLSALDVLPEIGLPIQEYFIFVYNHYCTHRSIPARQVIQEYRLLKEYPILQDIARLKAAGGRRSDPLYVLLKARGLQFLDAWLRSQKDIDPTNRVDLEKQLRLLMNMAANSYLKYLQLRSHGMKDAQCFTALPCTRLCCRNERRPDDVALRVTLPPERAMPDCRRRASS